MDFLKEALNALPSVAGSPMAFVGYIATIASWIWAVTRNQRIKILLERIKDIPESDRAETIRNEMGVILPSNINPEEWIRSRKHQYFLIAFIVFSITVLSIVAISINSTSLAWDEFNEPLKENGWQEIIKLYRDTPPDIEDKITYDEAKARAFVAETKGDFYQAIALAESALRKKPSDYILKSKVSEYFVAVGDYDEAHKAKVTAINALKNELMVFKRFANEAAVLYMELGNVNERRKKSELALYAYEQAEFYAIESENKRVLDDIASKRAVINESDHGIEVAKKSYLRAVANFGNYSEKTATKANNLALAYQRSGDYRLAETQFKIVINILENLKLNDSIKLAMSYVNIAALYEVQGNFEMADIYYQKMLSIFGPSENKIAFNVFYNAMLESIKQGKKSRADDNYKRASKFLNLLPINTETNRDRLDLEKKKKNIDDLINELKF